MVCLRNWTIVMHVSLAEIFEELSARGDEPDLLSVLTVLASAVIPGLPPGGGLQSKWVCVFFLSCFTAAQTCSQHSSDDEWERPISQTATFTSLRRFKWCLYEIYKLSFRLAFFLIFCLESWKQMFLYKKILIFSTLILEQQISISMISGWSRDWRLE